MCISLKPLLQAHDTLLLKWLIDETLLEFYEGRDKHYTMEGIHEDFYSAINTEYRFIAYLDELPIGYVQYYELDEDSYRIYGYRNQKVFGMDQFIGETTLWNKGIGSVLVKTIVEDIIDTYKPEVIAMDPQVRNKRSIRCYEKCGFTIVKLLPQQELHEGKLEDCYLMEYRV